MKGKIEVHIVDEKDKPHVLIVEDDWDESELVWIRPNYESARRTLRAWLAIRIVQFIEEQDEDERDDLSQQLAKDRPDLATAMLWQINFWLNGHDVGCGVDIMPLTESVDPLHKFAEKYLKGCDPTEQERIRKKVIRAIGEELGWSEIEEYEKRSIDQLPLL